MNFVSFYRTTMVIFVMRLLTIFRNDENYQNATSHTQYTLFFLLFRILDPSRHITIQQSVLIWINHPVLSAAHSSIGLENGRVPRVREKNLDTRRKLKNSSSIIWVQHLAIEMTHSLESSPHNSLTKL